MSVCVYECVCVCVCVCMYAYMQGRSQDFEGAVSIGSVWVGSGHVEHAPI